jgi:hypothetical protein
VHFDLHTVHRCSSADALAESSTTHHSRELFAAAYDKDDKAAMLELAKLMSREIYVGDQRQGLGRKVRNCFAARDAVDWLSQQGGVNPDRAVQLGVRMQLYGLLEHHSRQRPFTNSSDLFVFNFAYVHRDVAGMQMSVVGKMSAAEMDAMKATAVFAEPLRTSKLLFSDAVA